MMQRIERRPARAANDSSPSQLARSYSSNCSGGARPIRQHYILEMFWVACIGGALPVRRVLGTSVSGIFAGKSSKNF
jgi:hypothetical protein